MVDEKIDRYLLFGGMECYYAEGGAHNLLKNSNNRNELMNYAMKRDYKDSYYTGMHLLSWWHIYDLKNNCIIMGSIPQPHPSDNLNASSVSNTSKDCMFFEEKANKWECT